MTDNTRALLMQTLETLSCGGGDYDLGHRCSHCDNYIDRNDGLRAAIRAELAKPRLDQAEINKRLQALADSEGTRAVEYLRRARKAESEIERLRAELSKPSTTPAWHDAPTCDGLWMCNEGDDNPYRWTTHRVTFPLNQLLVGEDERWYGPIQQDTKAEGEST